MPREFFTDKPIFGIQGCSCGQVYVCVEMSLGGQKVRKVWLHDPPIEDVGGSAEKRWREEGVKTWYEGHKVRDRVK